MQWNSWAKYIAIHSNHQLQCSEIKAKAITAVQYVLHTEVRYVKIRCNAPLPSEQLLPSGRVEPSALESSKINWSERCKPKRWLKCSKIRCNPLQRCIAFFLKNFIRLFWHQRIYDTTLSFRDIGTWWFLWRAAAVRGRGGIGYSSIWIV